jgi:nitrogen fixation/metabolism regulation signal transduction histidine kinase
MKLRDRLILLFLAATLLPLGLTWWTTLQLLERSFLLAPLQELDETSQALERTGRELYQQYRAELARAARERRSEPHRYGPREGPPEVRDFAASGEAERFALAPGRLDYLIREPGAVLVYSRPLTGVDLRAVSAQYSRSRAVLDVARGRDLRRGFRFTFLSIAGAAWLAAIAGLCFWAHRVARPVQQLAAGLTAVAAGDLNRQIDASRDDEIGQAARAFNRMTRQLARAREQLVQVTRLASWQAIARKSAHEVKNSLTPIRLTMEEIASRGAANEPAFLRQAAQIVVDEVMALERRVRAFSEFAAEPPVHLAAVDLAALVEERLALLRPAHPEVRYEVRGGGERVSADPDLVRSVLTNLLENAAEAAGAGGTVRVVIQDGGLEVHDSGPGLSELARSTLFEPAISFKKGGMGLGLSIARKSALACGGDLREIPSELPGAAFRADFPPYCQPDPTHEEAYSHR